MGKKHPLNSRSDPALRHGAAANIQIVITQPHSDLESDSDEVEDILKEDAMSERVKTLAFNENIQICLGEECVSEDGSEASNKIEVECG